MIALSVNLNKIALIRNSREGNFPDVLQHAKLCIDHGVQGITVHPRPDQRHIRPTDVEQLHTLIANKPTIEFNMEGNPFSERKGSYPGFLELVSQYPPHQCTLVPDTETQLTSDHGFDLRKNQTSIKNIIGSLQAKGIRVSLFMDPDIEQIKRAADLGTNRIELYTGPFAKSFSESGISAQTNSLFKQYSDAAREAHKLGLGINAGHDLNLENLLMFRNLPYLAEVSIGHALIVDAINMGLARTIKSYLAALEV